jgi:hypothetical protein
MIVLLYKKCFIKQLNLIQSLKKTNKHSVKYKINIKNAHPHLINSITNLNKQKKKIKRIDELFRMKITRHKIDMSLINWNSNKNANNQITL